MKSNKIVLHPYDYGTWGFYEGTSEDLVGGPVAIYDLKIINAGFTLKYRVNGSYVKVRLNSRKKKTEKFKEIIKFFELDDEEADKLII